MLETLIYTYGSLFLAFVLPEEDARYSTSIFCIFLTNPLGDPKKPTLELDIEKDHFKKMFADYHTHMKSDIREMMHKTKNKDVDFLLRILTFCCVLTFGRDVDRCKSQFRVQIVICTHGIDLC